MTNKYITKIAEVIRLTPEEAAHLLYYNDPHAAHRAKSTGQVVGGIVGGTLGTIGGAMAGAAIGAIPVLRPAQGILAGAGAVLGGGALGYHMAKNEGRSWAESADANHKLWSGIRDALDYDHRDRGITVPYKRPLILEEEDALRRVLRQKDPYKTALEEATEYNHEKDEEVFDRTAYYETLDRLREENSHKESLRQKLGLSKTAGLTRILGSKGFTGALKGAMASTAGRAKSVAISDRPLFPSMGQRVTAGGQRLFQKPMTDAQFRFNKPQLVERAKLLENAGTFPKLKIQHSGKFIKNTQGMSSMVAASSTPKELFRRAQIKELANKANFRADATPTGTVKIPTLNQRIPPDGPASSF